MWLSFVLLGLFFGQAVAQEEATSDINMLSALELSQLTTELLAWTNSPAGREASRMGLTGSLTPSDSGSGGTMELSPADVPARHLKRFLHSKQAVDRLRKRHPRARFSLETPFALMSEQEFAEFVNKQNAAKPGNLTETVQLEFELSSANNASRRLATLPTEVDWQKQGCVTRVKNQGPCGVCWIFSSVSTLESSYCINSGKNALVELSEQDVLSCGIGGCQTGLASKSFSWMTNYNGGSVCTAATFPYTTTDLTVEGCRRYDDPTRTCTKPDLGLVSFVSAPYLNHEDLERVIAERPATAQLKAGVAIFQYYSGGVIMGDEDRCPSARPDHELTIVGYGVRNGVKYWKVKNSWGTSWGEQGYGYVERGFQGSYFGACGIESWSTYPVLRSQAPWFETLQCGAVRVGIEVLGQDFRTVSVPTFDQCCDACRLESGCKAATWNANVKYTCRLKATIDGERPYADLSRSSVVIAPKTNDQCLPVERHVDYYGNDIARALAATPTVCCEMCTRNPSCVVYTWATYMGGSCFLKSAKGNRQQLPPLADGSPSVVSGEVYRCQALRTNVDFPGEDLMGVPATRASDCCGICRATASCAAFSWSGYLGGMCWLKARVANVVASSGVTSATVY